MIAANRDAAPDDEPSGRAPTGQFAAGNSYAKGNRHSRRVSASRDAIAGAITADDLADVAKALLVKAKEGDVSAARELFDRCLGKAVPMPSGDDDDIGPTKRPTPEELRALLEKAGHRIANAYFG
ncbi:MAG: hypothetical protein K8U03_10540 [Planctomycetia bacterium]|nr:hypothetical protein [Planctomycetia bacterium]